MSKFYCLLFLHLTIFSTFAFANVRNCYKCEGINCLRLSSNKTEDCLDPLDICVSVFHNSEVVQRGCYLGIPYHWRLKCDSREKSPECHKCNNDRCNDLNRDDLLCVQCNSNDNKDCLRNAKNIPPQRCPIVKASNAYCFAKTENGVTTRGCANDTLSQRKCLKSANCSLCLPSDIKGCNAIDLKSSSLLSFLSY